MVAIVDVVVYVDVAVALCKEKSQQYRGNTFLRCVASIPEDASC